MPRFPAETTVRVRGALRAALLAAALALPAGCASLPPDIVPAQAWGSVPADASRARRHAIERITVHHGGLAFAPGRDTAEYLRALQAWSRRDRLWIDVPYHFVIDPAGRVYEGRDIAFAGDTNTDYDPAGHALVVVLGNFEVEEPGERQLAALVSVLAHLSATYQVPPGRIGGHRDHAANTACPGRNLARYLDDGTLREAVAARLRAGAGSRR